MSTSAGTSSAASRTKAAHLAPSAGDTSNARSTSEVGVASPRACDPNNQTRVGATSRTARSTTSPTMRSNRGFPVSVRTPRGYHADPRPRISCGLGRGVSLPARNVVPPPRRARSSCDWRRPHRSVPSPGVHIGGPFPHTWSRPGHLDHRHAYSVDRVPDRPRPELVLEAGPGQHDVNGQAGGGMHQEHDAALLEEPVVAKASKAAARPASRSAIEERTGGAIQALADGAVVRQRRARRLPKRVSLESAAPVRSRYSSRHRSVRGIRRRASRYGGLRTHPWNLIASAPHGASANPPWPSLRRIRFTPA